MKNLKREYVFMSKKKKPKIIIWDIETSLSMMAGFSLYPNYIPHTNLLKDTHIVCVCWKELGKKRVHSVSTYTFDDKKLCQKIRDEFQDADLLIAHNGDKFDLKTLNSRLMVNNIEPLGPLVTLDTLKEVKKIARFSSNKLDYLGKVLCGHRKLKTDSELWLRVLRGEKKAVNEMVRYCKQDVLLLEEVYLKIRKYIKGHPVLHPHKGEVVCPICGSKHATKDGVRRTKSGILYQRYRCQDCGSRFQKVKSIINTDYK